MDQPTAEQALRRLEPLVGEDGQSYFEPGNPLLSHASPRCPARPHARCEPHPYRWAAAAVRATRRAPRQQPGPAAAVGIVNK